MDTPVPLSNTPDTLLMVVAAITIVILINFVFAYSRWRRELNLMRRPPDRPADVPRLSLPSMGPPSLRGSVEEKSSSETTNKHLAASIS